jgi:hypothetical protein
MAVMALIRRRRGQRVPRRSPSGKEQQIDHSFHIASDCGLDGFTIVALPRADQISIAPAQCLAERRQLLQSPLPAGRLALTGRGSDPVVFSHDGAAACYARWRGRRPRSQADERVSARRGFQNAAAGIHRGAAEALNRMPQWNRILVSVQQYNIASSAWAGGGMGLYSR